ncbi:hypothetical protein DFJ58DRAFT_772526 [Suillus subalutaceus]|uniref:uncharacterized protein n=1 Tax=Suillus subalutaceus TaxID=48586 RepID=UPI001B86EEE9|nr:uncharacterized protein DFJ58DRAFT_772526 [Suillus subalutaceus]KAG1864711.1 hypothetical protein DFJ58DRAFT_772526 [Suillus subalutaceus]
MAMNNLKHSLPPLPPIQGELMLDVYTHRSMLGRDIDENTVHGNTERLAELGSSVLSMLVVYTLYSEKPMLPAHDLKMRQAEMLSDKNIGDWLSLYGLKAKIRCADKSVLDRPEEARFLFNSYVGAVYTQKGLQEVMNWVGRLVNPSSEPPTVPGDTTNNQPATTPPPPPPMYYSQPPPPPPPSTAPPPMPSMPPPVPSQGVLAIFNQTCMQRGLTVEWKPEMTGPPHNPRWEVKCIVSGQHRGTGAGRNQKQAKEQAATEAYQYMQATGWGLL